MTKDEAVWQALGRRVRPSDKRCTQPSSLTLVPVLPPHQPLPRYLSQPELQAFFAVITDPRDRALFALVYHYGLRVSEVGLLTWSDVDLTRHRIVVKRVKGGYWTERPLFASTERLVRTYGSSMSSHESLVLFPGRMGPLRKRQIQVLFGRYRDRASLDPHYTAHSLRHYAGLRIMPGAVADRPRKGGSLAA